MHKLTEVAKLFLKLGFTAFGGPAAHISLMHDETVKRRKWLDDQQFLDLIGATNLIPGPNSTEMAIHIGYLRAGWPYNGRADGAGYRGGPQRTAGDSSLGIPARAVSRPQRAQPPVFDPPPVAVPAKHARRGPWRSPV